MKKLIKKTLTASALALTVVVFSATVALAALTLDTAKSQGLVGERPDGLIGAVKATPEATALVAATNAERMERYKDIAAKNGTAVSQVQALAGKKLTDQTPEGEYVMSAGGGWQKK